MNYLRLSTSIIIAVPYLFNSTRHFSIGVLFARRDTLIIITFFDCTAPFPLILALHWSGSIIEVGHFRSLFPYIWCHITTHLGPLHGFIVHHSASSSPIFLMSGVGYAGTNNAAVKKVLFSHNLVGRHCGALFQITHLLTFFFLSTGN